MSRAPIPAERRASPRKAVSHPVRLRPADSEDAYFEEVQDSRDVSKEGLSFVTPVERYYLGMKLRVTFPYTSAVRVELAGKVSRIDVLRKGYLVALRLD